MRGTIFERSLFSGWRLVVVLFVAFTAALFDMYVLHVVGIETFSEVISQTLIYATGRYIGVTFAAYFN